MGLKEYRKKRDFKKTKEPSGGKISRKKPIFVIQEHWASHHHFDFRLEAFGVLLSWAVPKGPPTEPGDKRLAVEVEDHPISYAKFHGTIPEGEYGGGEVEIWDSGYWVPPENIKEQLKKGHLEVQLHGKKLKGRWLLQRTSRTSGKKNQWLLIKRHDVEEKKTVTKKVKKKAPWPGFLAPQLALLSDSVPEGTDWIHETKYDGYRTAALINKKSVKLYTRNGLDWTEKYRDIHNELKKLKTSNAILDGEIVVLDENGVSSFSMLQAALSDRDSSAMKYFVFDLLFLDGEDLRDKPLEERKLLLKKLLKTGKSKKILFSEHIRGQGEEMFKLACQEGLEGIISKDRTAAYHAGRKSDWQKIKCSQRQELVIGGYTEPEGSRAGFGSLLMGLFEKGHLRYVGRVGTGFTDKNLAKMHQKLLRLETDKSPFTDGSPKDRPHIHWVKPELVGEVEFGSWTADGIIRHAAFVGLREDKSAEEVHMEKPAHLNENKKKAKSKTGKAAKGFVVTHPDRVVYPSTGTKKIDVVNYYKSVSPWLMKYISGRPLALIRCPDGVGSTCFFQKQADENSKLTAVNKDDALDQRVMSVDSEEGLLQLIQWGALELHTWQSHQKTVMYPDQLVFDLDPDEGLPWAKVREAAFRLKDLLKRLSLESYIKTTGGKGLHIHVPIAPLYSWEQIKNFCKSVTIQLSSEFPADYTTNILKKNRKGRIFLDYLRNGFGATAIAPFSVRAKDKPTVAVPITWEELKKLKRPDQFDIHSTLKRLAGQKKDPWAGYEKQKQKILILKKKESFHAATA